MYVHTVYLVAHFYWYHRCILNICCTGLKQFMTAPQYLIDIYTLYKPVCNLRCSHDQTQRVVSRFNISLSGQCFGICAPKVWNELLQSIREVSTIATFKYRLKPISLVNCDYSFLLIIYM